MNCRVTHRRSAQGLHVHACPRKQNKIKARAEMSKSARASLASRAAGGVHAPRLISSICRQGGKSKASEISAGPSKRRKAAAHNKNTPRPCNGWQIPSATRASTLSDMRTTHRTFGGAYLQGHGREGASALAGRSSGDPVAVRT